MLRTLALALILLSISGSALAPPQPITALAAFEVLADGFGNLRGIVVDDDDRVYAADREAGTVTRLGADGRRVIARRLERPVGLALDLQGRLLVAEERGARVVRLDPAGPTPIVRGIKQPRWLAVSDRGTIYISARRLTRDADPEPDDESAEPETILALAPDGTLSVFADGFDHLQGLAVHHDAVYAATTGSRGVHRQGGVVYRIPVRPDGQAGPVVRVGPRDVFERPIGLTVDRLGALYLTSPVADLEGRRSRQAIVKLQPDGRATTFASSLDTPRGLAFDGHGNLYVTDGNAGRILRFLAPAAPSLAAVPRFTTLPILPLTGTTITPARVDVFVNDAPTPVTVVSTQSGAFNAGIPLVANSDHSIEVFATAARGDGLTSPATEADVVRDASAPEVVWQAPPAGAFVRGTVAVRADAVDSLSEIATLSLSAGGQALAAGVAPPLPAPVAGASASWNTAAGPDGTQSLAATATDRAGNSVTVTRAVIVDNTPPETEIVDGPSGAIADTTASFTFRGADNLAAAPSLQFAWRLDGNAPTPFSGATTATLSGLAPGEHVFEVVARDPAGNEDPTPARRIFSVAALRVAIATPAPGATVPGDVALVRGTVSGSGLEVGVSVNGLAALVHGGQWAVEIPIVPGGNVITAVARAATGGEGTTSITVTGVADAPAIFVRAEPASGLAPLQVTWRVTTRTLRPIVRFELDEAGGGTFGAPVSALDGTQSLYLTAGLRFPTVRAIDDQGTVHVATTIVQADEPQAAADRFQALWSGFKARLQAGDRAGALSQLSPALRPRFEPIFGQLAADLPAIAAGLGSIALIDQLENLAETALIQVEDGAARLYFIYFRRDNRGQWLIQEM